MEIFLDGFLNVLIEFDSSAGSSFAVSLFIADHDAAGYITIIRIPRINVSLGVATGAGMPIEFNVSVASKFVSRTILAHVKFGTALLMRNLVTLWLVTC